MRLPVTYWYERRKNERFAHDSACRASRCSPSERGAGSPKGLIALVVIGLVVWIGIRYTKATVIAAEFEGGVKGIVQMNPMMPDEEVAQRVETAAKKTGVRHDPASVRVERAGMGGSISTIRVSYQYDVLPGWNKSAQAVVSP